MRLTKVKIANLAGLSDFETQLPATALAGLAGPNGAGKSTLLVACLAPWMRNLPPPDRARFESSVEMEIQLSARERRELQTFSAESLNDQSEVPDSLVVRVFKPPRSNIRIDGNPAFLTAIQNLEFLADVPSLDVLYVPAERRLAASNGGQINLDLLSPTRRAQHVRDARARAFAEAGRLDENEFEQWATATSVAASLEGGDTATWDRLKAATDALLAPKTLMPVTARELNVGIGLPDGRRHSLSRLSSGERQALIILGSILRAGASGTVAIVDEPDLHLHPRLAAQLFDAINAISIHQLLVASHSPFLLDSLPFDSILEMRAGESPSLLSSETDRLDAYSRMGFRASEVAQADLVFVTEGADGERLRHIDNRLQRAVWRGVEGRARVIQLVEELGELRVPVIGVVDRDIEEPNIPASVVDRVVVWDAADLEGQLLQSDEVLQSWLDKGLVANGLDLASLRAAIDDLARSRSESAIAERAQQILADAVPNQFPGTRGNDPLGRLEEMWNNLHEPRDYKAIYGEALATARETVESEPRVFRYVRGKYVVGDVATRLTKLRSGDALLDVSMRDPAACDALRQLLNVLDRVMPVTPLPAAVAPLSDPSPRSGDIQRKNLRRRVGFATRVSGRRVDIPRLVAEALAEIRSFSTEAGVEPDGLPFAMYDRETADAIEMRVGITAKNMPALRDGLEEVVFPQWEVRVLAWEGVFVEQSERALEAIQAWMERNGEEPKGPAWEEFVDVPEDPASGSWKARLLQPVGEWAGLSTGE